MLLELVGQINFKTFYCAFYIGRLNYYLFKLNNPIYKVNAKLFINYSIFLLRFIYYFRSHIHLLFPNYIDKLNLNWF